MENEFETRQRSLVKTISWRIIATGVTLTVAYIITDKLVLSAEVAGISALLSTLFYFFHERVWNRINWGRRIK